MIGIENHSVPSGSSWEAQEETRFNPGRTLGSEEFPGNVELLATNDNNLLAVEELLGDDTGQAA